MPSEMTREQLERAVQEASWQVDELFQYDGRVEKDRLAALITAARAAGAAEERARALRDATHTAWNVTDAPPPTAAEVNAVVGAIEGRECFWESVVWFDSEVRLSGYLASHGDAYQTITKFCPDCGGRVRVEGGGNVTA